MTPTSAKAGRLYRLLGRQKALVPMGITANEARKNFLTLIEQVNDDRQPIEISSKRGDAVLMARADYLALEETAHLLRSPANACRLLESLEQTRRSEHWGPSNLLVRPDFTPGDSKAAGPDGYHYEP